MKCKYMKSTMFLITTFFLLKGAVLLGLIERTRTVSVAEHALIISFGVAFAGFVRGYIARGKEDAAHNAYVKKLNSVIIS